MDAIFMINSSKKKRNLELAYSNDCVDKLNYLLTHIETYFFKDIIKANFIFSDVKYIFSTWDMPKMSESQIRYHFPNLKCLFYAAGDSSYFTEPFVKLNIKVIDAKEINSVPVVEFVLGLILLSPKQYIRSIKMYQKSLNPLSFFKTRENIDEFGGNYKITIGIVGAGSIGHKLIASLDKLGYKVYYYDPYVTLDRKEYSDVSKVEIDFLLNNCDIISNHLPNNKFTSDFFDVKRFSMMKKNVIFINTGRGNQVNEKDLILFSKKNKSASIFLDVTKKEPLSPLSRIKFQKNIIITPHIAGSVGKEKARLGDYMVSKYIELFTNETV